MACKCLYCRRPVVRGETKTGRTVLLDPEPVVDGTWIILGGPRRRRYADVTIADVRGQSAMAIIAQQRNAPRYQNHDRTCSLAATRDVPRVIEVRP